MDPKAVFGPHIGLKQVLNPQKGVSGTHSLIFGFGSQTTVPNFGLGNRTTVFIFGLGSPTTVLNFRFGSRTPVLNLRLGSRTIAVISW